MAAPVTPVAHPSWPVRVLACETQNEDGSGIATATLAIERGIGSFTIATGALAHCDALQLVVPGLRGCEGLTLNDADIRHHEGVHVSISPASEDNNPAVSIVISRTVLDGLPPQATLRVVDFFR